MDVIKSWFLSDLNANILNVQFKPVEHPTYKNEVRIEKGIQGAVYHVVQPKSRRSWVLKKFYPEKKLNREVIESVRDFVPRGVNFKAASKRRILTPENLKLAGNLFYSKEFARWLDGTILMPKLRGETWATVSQKIRKKELNLSIDKRIFFAKSLIKAVILLEEYGCAHRDLSNENIILDLKEYVVYLIDWDSLYHNALSYYNNAPHGSNGYMPPWICNKPKDSWNRKADRFALSLLICELLLLKDGSPSYHNGTFFSQKMFYSVRDPFLSKKLKELGCISKELKKLLINAIKAKSFDECPSPDKWLEVINDLKEEKKQIEDFEEEEDVEFKEDKEEQEYQEDKEKHEESEGDIETEDEEEQEENDDEDEEYEDEIISTATLENDKNKPAKKKKEKKKSTPDKVKNKTKVNNLKKEKGKIKDSTLSIDYKLLAIVFIFPALLGIVYLLDGNNFFKKNDKILVEDSIPLTNIKEENEVNQSVISQKYLIKISYSDNDLKLKIDGKEVGLSKKNSAFINTKPGFHLIELTFSSLIFNSTTGEVKRSSPVTRKQKILFGNKKDITIQVSRKEKIWTVQ